MNTTLEAPPGPDRSVPLRVTTQPSSARPTVPRSSAADRLALRLGLALVIWGRRHVDRADARHRALALRVAVQHRSDRELAAQRLLHLTVPPR